MKKNQTQIANQNRVILKEILTELPQYNEKYQNYDFDKLNDKQMLALFCIGVVLEENNDYPYWADVEKFIQESFLVKKFGKPILAKGKTAIRKVYNGEIDLKGLNGYMRFFIGGVLVSSILSTEQNWKKIGYDSVKIGSDKFVGA